MNRIYRQACLYMARRVDNMMGSMFAGSGTYVTTAVTPDGYLIEVEVVGELVSEAILEGAIAGAAAGVLAIGNGYEGGSKTVKPESAVTGSKKHGVNWKEGPARAKATGNPQGQWAASDIDYATEMANTLGAGESGYFDLPEGSESIVHMPDGTTQQATQMWIRNNGTGTWHGYPMP